MNYNEIVEAALSYSDRTDIETTSKMDVFLRVVEARINRMISVREMFCRAVIDIVEDLEYLGLPADFLSLRDIEVQSADGSKRYTPVYVNPEQMNDAHSNLSEQYMYTMYTIIANQLQIRPVIVGGKVELVYRRKIPLLDSTNSQNWLSVNNPNIYIFGLLVEINSFAKDAASAQLWDTRFNIEIDALQLDDNKSRWSGTPLRIRAGG